MVLHRRRRGRRVRGDRLRVRASRRRIGLGGAGQDDAGSLVSGLDETGAVEADAGGLAAPDVGGADLAAIASEALLHDCYNPPPPPVRLATARVQ